MTWNQSGTNMPDGYTEVYLGADFNLAGTTTAGSTYAAEANMKGFSRLEAASLNLGTNGMVGSTVNFNITGANNTLILANNINIANGSNFADGTVSFSMTGEGNSIIANTINTSDGSNKDAAMSGNVSFYAKGASATNKNTIVLTSSEWIVQGSQAAGSTFSANITLAGNTALRGAGGKGVWLKVNEWGGKNYTSNATFTVSGSGNDLLFSGLEIGKDTTDGGGKGIFEIVGGGSSILISNDSDGHNGFRLQRGGVLSYKINNTGITTIKNDTWNNTTFEGNLEVSFEGLTGIFADERFVLFATTDMSLDQSGRMNLWFNFSDWNNLQELADYIKVLLRDPSDSYRFALETYHDGELDKDVQALVVYYTSTVPEPAAISSLFGLIAFVLAVRRRRRLK
jgi:hypothetical protein